MVQRGRKQQTVQDPNFKDVEYNSTGTKIMISGRDFYREDLREIVNKKGYRLLTLKEFYDLASNPSWKQEYGSRWFWIENLYMPKGLYRMGTDGKLIPVHKTEWNVPLSELVRVNELSSGNSAVKLLDSRVDSYIIVQSFFSIARILCTPTKKDPEEERKQLIAEAKAAKLERDRLRK